jgi:sugar phosphate isomerase/epimerase
MAMKSCVTISLVAEARGGPFVFWDDLAAGCGQAARLGFDAVEVFASGTDAVNAAELHDLLHTHHLSLAALGTGAGWLKHKLTLTSPDAAVRERAVAFVRSIIDLGGPFGASAIIGSMQGRWGDGLDKQAALELLTRALNTLGDHARIHGVPLMYEPLNRYETNLVNTMEEGVHLLKSLTTDNVVLLADLFHMNIEETDLAAALRTGGRRIGHVHFVDSNRRPAGRGHLDFMPIIAALRDIGYQGYLSAEALPYPTPWEAAQQTITTYRRLVPGSY